MHFREILHKNHMGLLFGMLKVVYKGVNSWTHKHHQNSASPQLDYIQPIHSPRSLNLVPFLISKESTHIFHSYHTTSFLHTAGLQWFIPQNVFWPPFFSLPSQGLKAACFLCKSTDHLISQYRHESTLQNNNIPAPKPSIEIFAEDLKPSSCSQ